MVVDQIIEKIYIIRGNKVMLDFDLAVLYGVSTKRLNEQVKRNIERFPEDFMFKLNPDEMDQLDRSQIATGSQKHRDSRNPPFAFTEHGAVMLASVPNSVSAIKVSILVVRTFVQLRSVLTTHKELALRVDQLEKKTDYQFASFSKLFSQIICESKKPKRKESFGHPEKLDS